MTKGPPITVKWEKKIITYKKGANMQESRIFYELVLPRKKDHFKKKPL